MMAPSMTFHCEVLPNTRNCARRPARLPPTSGAVSCTPGVTASTENTSWPVGSTAVSSLLKLVATTAFVTSMIGESPTTVTVSATLATPSVMLRLDVKPGVSVTPSRTTVENP
jgi:hypothetical protein